MLEPYQEAELIAYEGDKWLAKRPICIECDDHIAADKCYVFDPIYPRESCMCEECYSRQLSRLNEWLQDILDDAASEYWQTTPEEEI